MSTANVEIVFNRELKGNFQVEYFRYANKVSGIYSITNMDNGKIYIGQCMNYRDRAAIHRRDLKNNTHYNIYMQRVYNKGCNLIMQLIETCSLDNLTDREIFWIKFLGTNDKSKGYNLTIGGEGTRGWVHTKEWSEKMSITMTGRKREKGKSFINSNPVLLYTYPEGKFYREFNTVSVAASNIGVKPSALFDILAGRYISVKGYFPVYKSSDNYSDLIEVVQRKDRTKIGKRVTVYDMNDNVVKVYRNSRELDIDTNMFRGAWGQRFRRSDNKILIIDGLKYVQQ